MDATVDDATSAPMAAGAPCRAAVSTRSSGPAVTAAAATAQPRRHPRQGPRRCVPSPPNRCAADLHLFLLRSYNSLRQLARERKPREGNPRAVLLLGDQPASSAGEPLDRRRQPRQRRR